MKEFNLEEGKEVCTRNGLSAFVQYYNIFNIKSPIGVLIRIKDSKDISYCVRTSGKINFGEDSEYDLFMKN